MMSVGIFILLPAFSKNDCDQKQAAIFAVIGFFISAVILSTTFFISRNSQMHDVEIINGRITGKERLHDTYLESYSCNCRTVTRRNSNGTTSSHQECDTCYRRHYTVDWNAKSTIGSFDIKKLDWTDEDVYRQPDPQRYKDITIGEACSRTNSYTNYVKAVPESLFRPASGDLKKTYAAMLPGYPDNIYDIWKLNRVIPVGVNVPNLKEWNDKLSLALISLGSLRQVNVIVVLANTADESYSYALQDAWINGKKNDVIVVIGAPKFPNRASWVRVLAWTDSELFKVKLQDEIMKLPTLEAHEVITTTSAMILNHYVRKPMKDFEYLEAEIDPPLWVMLIAIGFIVLSYLAFWIAMLRGVRFGGPRMYRRRSFNRF
jgi:hypothetical protein